MAYPVEFSGTVAPRQFFTGAFRPVAAGLVSVIVNGNGQVPPPPSPPPGAPETEAPLLGLKLEVFKPGASAPEFSQGFLKNLGVPLSKDQIIASANVMAAAADLAADWTVRITNTGNLLSAYGVTVRFQVLAGNLGKIDHIVILMMENRSFDHMLGYLHLPGGANRTDVDGLTGHEFNNGRDGQPIQVFRLDRTYFANDPGHGWDDVADQLSSPILGLQTTPAVSTLTPVGAPIFTSNAGFLTNFTQQLDNQAKSLPPLIGNVKDQSLLAPGKSKIVHFRPGAPGTISVRSTPSPAPALSATGRLLLRRADGTQLAVASSSFKGGSLALSYSATAADLAASGDWTCEVVNQATAIITFTTIVTFVQATHNTSGQEPAASIMGYHDATHLPVYDHLAAEFAICDRWFASLPTDTWPNRLYGLTGGSGGDINTPSANDVVNDPPGFKLTTIFEVLQNHGVDWINYFSDLPFSLIFERLAQDATFTAQMRPIAEFFDLCETGDLPSVSWLDPNFTDVPDGVEAANDDHPPGDVKRGQQLVAQVYNALCTSPAWSKTLFLITYDEHGGLYDHVLPPGTPAKPLHAPNPSEPLQTAGPGGPPDDFPGLQRYGVRVPAFVVSAWVERGFVAKKTYDHTSLISTILRRFCVAADGSVPSMGKRADAANDVGAVLSAAAPRPGLLSPALAAAAPNPVPAFLPEAFGSVLRKFLVGF